MSSVTVLGYRAQVQIEPIAAVINRAEFVDCAQPEFVSREKILLTERNQKWSATASPDGLVNWNTHIRTCAVVSGMAVKNR